MKSQETRKRGASRRLAVKPRATNERKGLAAATAAKPSKSKADAAPQNVLVVGIGASAGGLEPLKQFFQTMRNDSGIAFVVVQHLEPTHRSQMAEILAKHTGMRVVQADNHMAIEANTVYTIPADRRLSIQDGLLRLIELAKNEGIRRPIDFFLDSLAQDRKDRSVAIILSGSSCVDGPLGVLAIRSAGGMCIAQDPATAEFPALPQGVIETGLVDCVLAPDQMPQQLLNYASHPYLTPPDRPAPASWKSEDDFTAILDVLRAQVRADYRQYKKSTLERRIQRRMGLRQIGSMADYLKVVKQDKNEALQLSKDMLIGVSSFFRDSEEFETLRRDVIVPLVAKAANDRPLRAWVAGCATGEEAYSIAILLAEEVAAAGKNCPIYVFASDVDDEALEIARAGCYFESIASDVSADRLERFFTHAGQHYTVSRRLRGMVVFARQNLISNPPFSKIDLVSCRNVLIYLEHEAQKKIFAMFSFALNANGCLFLGKSEGISGMDGLFQAVSVKGRIFRLTKPNRQAAAEFSAELSMSLPAAEAYRPAPVLPAAHLALLNQQILLKHFRAGIVLVDRKYKAIHFFGATEKYLGHTKGQASLNLLDMASSALSSQLRRAIDQSSQENKAFSFDHIPTNRKKIASVHVTVEPVLGSSEDQRLLAVIFEDGPAVATSTRQHKRPAEEEPMIAHLEAEARTRQAEFEAIIQAYEVAGQELKVAHEEVMSMNEEFQSTNEEMETSKEELQSVNEELNTLNSELNERVSEISQANNDLTYLFQSTETATIFLDLQLCIRRFTVGTTQLMHLSPSDVGRPLNQIKQRFQGDIADDALGVLQNEITFEKDILSQSGHWYTLRILPYRTQENRVDGVVITFFDVTRLKQAERTLLDAKSYAESIVQTVREPLVVLDADMHVLSANAAFYKFFRVAPQQILGQRIYDLANRMWDIPILHDLLEKIIPVNSQMCDFQMSHDFPTIGPRTLLLNARRIEQVGLQKNMILLALEDVTQRVQDRKNLQSFATDLEQRVTERTAVADSRANQLRELAFELTQAEHRERQRLARVLHDNLQQLLVAAKFQVAVAGNKVNGTAAKAAIGTAMEMLDESLAVARLLTTELSPSILHQVGLGAGLAWLARQMKDKHGLTVYVNLDAEVRQDENGVVILLFQAVRELLFNIVKHAQVREASVLMSRIEPDQVQIVVEDKGVGFDQTIAARGLDSPTGLGLFSISERIEYLGGQVDIKSAPGSGTCVTIVARLSPSPAGKTMSPLEAPQADETSKRSQSKTARIAARTNKIRVLLADDHKIVRQGVAGMLQLLGDVEVVAEAEDGQQALDMARSVRPDVIVMDLDMPVMDGVQATRQITAELPQIAIIGLSMFDKADRAADMRQAGAVDYRNKSDPLEELIAAIRKHAPRRSP